LIVSAAKAGAASAEVKESLIAAEITIEGKIEGNGNIRVAGRFKGNVNVKGELMIEPGASIDGEQPDRFEKLVERIPPDAIATAVDTKPTASSASRKLRRSNAAAPLTGMGSGALISS
jgi:hypothetical protein